MTHMSLILRWTHRIVASSPQISRSSTPITSSNEFDGDVFWEIMAFDKDAGRSRTDIVMPRRVFARIIVFRVGTKSAGIFVSTRHCLVIAYTVLGINKH